jgi:hypothetical protein
MSWNAPEGTLWAATIGSLAYVLGYRGSRSVRAIGFVGLGLVGLSYLLTHIRRWLTGRDMLAPEQPRRTVCLC